MGVTGKIRNESQMAEAVARHIKGVCGVKLEDCIFDVVAYDKAMKLFKVVECKLSFRPAGIGRTFGQVEAYYSVIADRGRDFVDAINKKLDFSFNELLEATANAQRIRIAFYVALTRQACKRVDLIRSLKRRLPNVGIIRVNPNSECRDYIRHHGLKDHEMASATPITVRILQSRTAK